MFTLIYLYLLNYIVLYFIILYFTINILNLNLNNNISLNLFISFIKKYFKFNPLLLVLLILSGLPPFSFFIIKVNILLKILENNSLFLIFLIFFNLLLTMFFYLQFFKLTNNLKINIKKYFKFNRLRNFNTRNHYNFTYIYVLFISMNIIYIYIFTDCCLIIESFLFKCQQKIKV